MKTISFEESKVIMLETLRSIDKCCRENNIDYSLSWGTMIGAIRHHGFIPWDDDIDLMMSRKDYNRFIEVYDDPNFNIYTPLKDKNCIQLLTKIYRKDTRILFNNYKRKSLFGLWVTIFPYDNAPDEGLKKWERTRSILLSLYHFRTVRYLDSDSLVRKIVKFFLKIPVVCCSSFTLAKKIEKHLSKYNHLKTQNICIWDNGVGFNCFFYFPSALFEEYEDVDFDGIKCKIIKGYDQFLRMYYGDYMQLPPEKDRVPLHDYVAYYVKDN